MEAGSPAPASQHDPDIDAIRGDRRETDVAAVEHDHPGVTDRGPARIGDVECQCRPITKQRPTDDSAGSRHNRSKAVRPDDDPRHKLAPACERRDPVADRAHGNALANVRARLSRKVEEMRIEA